MKTRLPIRLFVSLIFTFMVTAVCSAQAQKTFVSPLGNDGLACTSPLLPCRSFTGALGKTAAGGEIVVTAAGDFGPVTIGQSVTITAVGTIGGISVNSGNAITVNTLPSDTVILRGLSLDGRGAATAGIQSVGGGTLHIEDSTIDNFAANGIDFSPAFNGAVLIVRGTTLRNNLAAGTTTGGAFLHPQAGVGTRILFDGVHFDHNNIGLRAEDNAFVTLKNSDVFGSAMTGVMAFSAGVANTTVDMENCVVSLNFADGVTSKGGLTTVTLSNVSVSRNAGFGLRSSNSGQVLSYGNNRVSSNSTDGSPTGTITTK